MQAKMRLLLLFAASWFQKTSFSHAFSSPRIFLSREINLHRFGSNAAPPQYGRSRKLSVADVAFVRGPADFTINSFSHPATRRKTQGNAFMKSLKDDSDIERISKSYSFLILGGTGRIGTAVASHLLLRSPQSKVVLVGRNEDKCQRAVQEVLQDLANDMPVDSEKVTFQVFDFKTNPSALRQAVSNTDCVIHTAGPFLGEEPQVLQCVLDVAQNDKQSENGTCRTCSMYVDVSDPLPYLDQGLSMSQTAQQCGVTALMAAGAFPGMSNVLAMEAAYALPSNRESPSSNNGDSDKFAIPPVKDVRFNYFTAGLGGSGDVNLYITNLGFGEPMVQYNQGKLCAFEKLSGCVLGEVSFFLQEEDINDISQKNNNGNVKNDNKLAQQRIGVRSVFAWPFPEAATVARHLQISGSSSAAMGTAPEAWNVMLDGLVHLIPRKWWTSSKFSQFLADFSKPLVWLTDAWLKLVAEDGVGETHAMRIDVVGDAAKVPANTKASSVSVVQAHESFRRCVGQSCAEFALDGLLHPMPGVWLPEQRYHESKERQRVVERLTTTPGTVAYTGPTVLKGAPRIAPARMEDVLERSGKTEVA